MSATNDFRTLENLIEKSTIHSTIDGKRFTDFDAMRYQQLRDKFINALFDVDALRDHIVELDASLSISKTMNNNANIQINELRTKLDAAKNIIDKLLNNLPDSYHPQDESWQWCWDELDSDAQDEVKETREKAREALRQINEGKK